MEERKQGRRRRETAIRGNLAEEEGSRVILILHRNFHLILRRLEMETVLERGGRVRHTCLR